MRIFNAAGESASLEDRSRYVCVYVLDRTHADGLRLLGHVTPELQL